LPPSKEIIPIFENIDYGVVCHEHR